MTDTENNFLPIVLPIAGILLNEEKKICTPQHSVNGYVPTPKDLQYDKAVCDCKKLMWVSVNTCGCPGVAANYELQARPNQ